MQLLLSTVVTTVVSTAYSTAYSTILRNLSTAVNTVVSTTFTKLVYCGDTAADRCLPGLGGAVVSTRVLTAVKFNQRFSLHTF